MDAHEHSPVLLRETIDLLGCRPGGLWVDGTVGSGGHAEAVLRATSPGGRLLAIDRDAEAIARARRRLEPFGERVVLRHSDFRRLPEILDETGAGPADGVLLDLGVSSPQLDDPGRGFSFREDGPLDMRMDRSQPRTAADLVNRLPREGLASLLGHYGEERAARRIAAAIVRERERAPIETTGRLARIVSAAAGRRGTRLHPATRTFQALRIAVNDELTDLDALLERAAGRLFPGGRLAVISFHSLEDRIVKRTIARLGGRCVCPRDLPVCACGRPGLLIPITRRAVRPSEAEVRLNPRSRSARLRVAERLPEERR
jgi:16S rRNA (cytosine1402-N4)-methyltransferase